MQSDVLFIKFLRAYGHLETTSRLSHLLPAVLGHHLMTAMVHIDTTLRTLLALFHEPIEEGAAVVAPRRVQVCGGAELVRCGNLSESSEIAIDGSHSCSAPQNVIAYVYRQWNLTHNNEYLHAHVQRSERTVYLVN